MGRIPSEALDTDDTSVDQLAMKDAVATMLTGVT